MVELINETNVIAADGSAFTVRKFGHIATCDADLACVRRIKQPGNMQKRRFSGARRGNKGDDFAFVDSQIGALQHGDRVGFARVIGLGDTREGQDWVIHNAAPLLGSCAQRGGRERS